MISEYEKAIELAKKWIAYVESDPSRALLKADGYCIDKALLAANELLEQAVYLIEGYSPEDMDDARLAESWLARLRELKGEK